MRTVINPPPLLPPPPPLPPFRALLRLQDTLGTNCLDTLQEYITQNNPEKLGAYEWKEKYWSEVLGMEHQNWGTGSTLQCGFSATTSCRDLARVAQLWLNDGHGISPFRGRVCFRRARARARVCRACVRTTVCVCGGGVPTTNRHV